MKNFEDRKKDYFKKLNENSEIVESIVRDPSSDQRFVEIIINPQTERELEIADSSITFFSDMLGLAFRKTSSEDINYEDNKYVIIVSDLINAIKAKDEIKVKEISDYLDSISDPIEVARYSFDFCNGFGSNPEDCYEYIAQKTGFDTSDFRESTLYNFYWNKAQEITKKERYAKIDYANTDIETDEQINTSIRVMKEFHRLYENEMNKGNTLR